MVLLFQAKCARNKRSAILSSKQDLSCKQDYVLFNGKLGMDGWKVSAEGVYLVLFHQNIQTGSGQAGYPACFFDIALGERNQVL